MIKSLLTKIKKELFEEDTNDWYLYAMELMQETKEKWKNKYKQYSGYTGLMDFIQNSSPFELNDTVIKNYIKNYEEKENARFWRNL